jgi:hypothetical protein
MLKPTFVAAAVAAFVLGLASEGAAQAPFTAKLPPKGLQEPTTTRAPAYDLTFGYQILRTPDETFPFGLNVDGARNFGAFGLVGEIGLALHSDEGVDTQLWHFAAGPRWTGRNSGTVWPFAQVLGGLGHYRFSVDDIDFSDSSNRFVLQPGAGVMVIGGDGWGIVGQVDYRRVFLDEEEDGDSGQNDFRVLIGVRLILD